ncbi:VPLPA-CTERM sorting domain-containing protein [Paracoccus subflavus]|uniref:VPLPA-CTERM sorting domain-containing protein n=1 Tax=Paracoccus subflavus TaxID=2528244 RepID=A0A4Q9FXG4_9RHOB|nr:VPLPA-CTERM sorting domain-containing protein [Paracoccus subflavus]TBN38688.1 VPLPA-CTERM sorting domain-containing protein [Paracoccus subflavus]
MRLRVLAAFLAAGGLAGAAEAATLIDGSTPGRYNSGIGTVLDGTNPFGGTFMFPLADVLGGDPALDIPAGNEPDLSAASTALGSWLTNPAAPGGAWSAGPVGIPASWPINSETAIIYELDGGVGGIGNVSASFGVDNGLFVWLNGTFLGGYLRPGGVSPGEFTLSLGSLGSGMNYLQILREDHGGASGYDVSVTGDMNPAPIPLPASGLLLAGGAAALAGLRRRRRAA